MILNYTENGPIYRIELPKSFDVSAPCFPKKARSTTTRGPNIPTVRKSYALNLIIDFWLEKAYDYQLIFYKGGEGAVIFH